MRRLGLPRPRALSRRPSAHAAHVGSIRSGGFRWERRVQRSARDVLRTHVWHIGSTDAAALLTLVAVSSVHGCRGDVGVGLSQLCPDGPRPVGCLAHERCEVSVCGAARAGGAAPQSSDIVIEKLVYRSDRAHPCIPQSSDTDRIGPPHPCTRDRTSFRVVRMIGD